MAALLTRIISGRAAPDLRGEGGDPRVVANIDGHRRGRNRRRIDPGRGVAGNPVPLRSAMTRMAPPQRGDWRLPEADAPSAGHHRDGPSVADLSRRHFNPPRFRLSV